MCIYVCTYIYIYITIYIYIERERERHTYVRCLSAALGGAATQEFGDVAFEDNLPS